MHYKDPKTLEAEKAERDRLTNEFLNKGGVITKYKYPRDVRRKFYTSTI